MICDMNYFEESVPAPHEWSLNRTVDTFSHARASHYARRGRIEASTSTRIVNVLKTETVGRKCGPQKFYGLSLHVIYATKQHNKYN